MDTRFHSVYLLASLDPRCSGYHYVGYSVNPIRRLRQHNGELVNGARRTSRRGRPWSLVLCLSGFSEDRVALKFEWCWQHPFKSSVLKNEADALRGLTRINFAIGTLHLLLRVPLFSNLALTLSIVDNQIYDNASSVTLRKRIPAPVRSPLLVIVSVTVDELAENFGNFGEPSRDDGQRDAEEYEAECISKEERGLVACTLCALPVCSLNGLCCARQRGRCELVAHLTCLALWFAFAADVAEIVPTTAIPCPLCDMELHWSVLVQQLKQRVNRHVRSITEEKAAVAAPASSNASACDENGNLRRKRRRNGTQAHGTQSSALFSDSQPSGRIDSDAPTEEDEEWLHF